MDFCDKIHILIKAQGISWVTLNWCNRVFKGLEHKIAGIHEYFLREKSFGQVHLKWSSVKCKVLKTKKFFVRTIIQENYFKVCFIFWFVIDKTKKVIICLIPITQNRGFGNFIILLSAKTKKILVIRFSIS